MVSLEFVALRRQIEAHPLPSGLELIPAAYGAMGRLVAPPRRGELP